MTIEWKKDSNVGINKEISNQYAIAPFMPGATMVPSAAPGDYGGQLGQDPEEPFVQIVDPYEVGGGQVLDMREQYLAKKAQMPQQVAPDEATVIQQLLALGQTMNEQPTVPPLPVADPIQQPVLSYAAPAIPIQQPVMGTVQQMPTPQPQPQPVAQTPLPQYGHAAPPVNGESWPAPVDVAVGAAPLPPVRHVPAPPPQQQVAARPAQPAQPVEVQFRMPDGSQIICYYHAVIRPDGQPTVVLVTDKRGGQGGTQFVPPQSQKGQPIALVLPAHGVALYVYSIGIQFAYDNREYMVLIVDEPKEETHGEDGTIGSGPYQM